MIEDVDDANNVADNTDNTDMNNDHDDIRCKNRRSSAPVDDSQ